MKITTTSTSGCLKSETAIYGSVEDIIKLAESEEKRKVSKKELQKILDDNRNGLLKAIKDNLNGDENGDTKNM